ncbi:tRNA (adenosine(37)-N6)-threonylcarbamoyltransferase complex transferase subunit TsaD [Numidum massiliense]|uniref:tRNA (adenosine(37)-N6)-threonylcarbamoyltransferase complex transferase subunit TsaD n=1 Tax=Numidum massiliense TaxID=1522315 RepID=UPI0006D55E48|nr:tRNA (adenosine(37)-N6)-threonylcarbamoyltransferase complex transferase subunit TsaD [Numidum massiliense]
MTNILGIETSCDETAVAVVQGGRKLLSNVVSSQIDIHRKFGGVVPEVASRHHVEAITVLLEEALAQAELTLAQIDAVAVTQGPGLVGALLIGVNTAKALAFARQLPLIPVHHIAGHIYANQLVGEMQFPLVALVVSGGHTELIYMEDHYSFTRLGQTRDDAAGEAYDKVARLLDLPYPGGPQVDELAHKGTATYTFPRAWLEPESLDFSFSGLKTAVMQTVARWEKEHGLGAEARTGLPKERNEQHERHKRNDVPHERMTAQKNGHPEGGSAKQRFAADVAASFQEAVSEVLIEKTFRAVRATGVKQLLVAGGVSANRGLREQLTARAKASAVTLHIPPLALCTDNAAMIAAAGYYAWKKKGITASWDLNADPGLSLV